MCDCFHCVYCFTPSTICSFSFALHNNIKITTNDDDKMRYVDESRSVFFSFLFSLFLHDFSLFYSSLEVSTRSVIKKTLKVVLFSIKFLNEKLTIKKADSKYLLMIF